MRAVLSIISAVVVMGCAASPAPDANGYNVQLYFDVGTTLVVGEPSMVTVQRIEQRTEQCTSTDSSCDPTAQTPITLISASCASLCTVSPVVTNGMITLDITGKTVGTTTLNVSVRSDVDGSEWDDAYPLTFR
jgi:hypothetical protein